MRSWQKWRPVIPAMIATTSRSVNGLPSIIGRLRGNARNLGNRTAIDMVSWSESDALAYALRRTNSSGNRRSIAKLEPSSSDGTMGQVQVQEPDSRIFLVCVTSFRRRLLDEDNLCEKFHVDCCRYAGLIPSDDPSRTQIQVRQEKVGSKAREFVRIEIKTIQNHHQL